MGKYRVMKGSKTEKANIGQVKERLSAYVTMAERGKTVVVCRRNKPVAELVGTESAPDRNHTRLGSDAGSVSVHCDLTVPAIAERDWVAPG